MAIYAGINSTFLASYLMFSTYFKGRKSLTIPNLPSREYQQFQNSPTIYKPTLYCTFVRILRKISYIPPKYYFIAIL